MELIKIFRDGDTEIENHITLENGMYKHRQIEKCGGRVFMRIKQRKIIQAI